MRLGCALYIYIYIYIYVCVCVCVYKVSLCFIYKKILNTKLRALYLVYCNYLLFMYDKEYK